jgi:hypothetical protein
MIGLTDNMRSVPHLLVLNADVAVHIEQTLKAIRAPGGWLSSSVSRHRSIFAVDRHLLIFWSGIASRNTFLTLRRDTVSRVAKSELFETGPPDSVIL